MPDPIPDVLVELLLLGELEDEEAAAVRAQLEAEGDPRLAELEASNAEIFDAYPPERVASELRALEPTNVVQLSWTSALVVSASVLAAVGLLWLVWPSEGSVPPPERVAQHQAGNDSDDSDAPSHPGDPGIRDKGTMRLLVHREGEDSPLTAGASVREGDVLQLSYAGASTYGVIVSLDGAGVTTLHFPDTPDASTRLGAGLVRLDHAYELDNAPEFERFFFVAADTPLDPADVMERVEAVGRDDAPSLPETWSAVSLLLTKLPLR